ncbi:MAG: hypothetical protein ABL983_05010 [Nitrospira sp.]
MHDAYNESLVWYGNGDIKGDNYKCQQEASSSSSGATGYIHMPMGANVMSMPMDSGGGRQINQQLYHSCMSARGYTLHDGYELNRWREKEVNGKQRLMTEKRAFDEQRRVLVEQQLSLNGENRVFEEQKRVLGEQKSVLDEQRVSVAGGEKRQQYEQAIGVYSQEVADFNKRFENYIKRVEDFNRRNADYSKQVADFNERLAGINRQ